MKTVLFVLAMLWSGSMYAQVPKTDLYTLIKAFMTDSTGFENVGDWAVGKPKTYPIKWNDDRVEMSDDTSINFFRIGSADITIDNGTGSASTQHGKWNVMLKGPRAGFSSFTLLSSALPGLYEKPTLNSLLGNKPFKATLLKTCDSDPAKGYYYYEVRIPKKDVEYIKLSWQSADNRTVMRIDGYDNFSKYAAKLNCP